MNSRIDQTHTNTHPSVWFFEKQKKRTDLHHLLLSGYREKHTPQKPKDNSFNCSRFWLILNTCGLKTIEDKIFPLDIVHMWMAMILWQSPLSKLWLPEHIWITQKRKEQFDVSRRVVLTSVNAWVLLAEARC